MGKTFIRVVKVGMTNSGCLIRVQVSQYFFRLRPLACPYQVLPTFAEFCQIFPTFPLVLPADIQAKINLYLLKNGRKSKFTSRTFCTRIIRHTSFKGITSAILSSLRLRNQFVSNKAHNVIITSISILLQMPT